MIVRMIEYGPVGTPITGQQDVTTGALPITDLGITCAQVSLKNIGSVALVYGNVNVTLLTGWVLDPGEQRTIEVRRLGQIYVMASSATRLCYEVKVEQ